MARSSRHPPSRGDHPERRRQDPETTTQRLLEAASREFIERGFEAARVNDIARSVGVTAGAVYGRWPHKTDVLVAALEYTLEKTLPEQELGNLGGTDAGSFDQLALLGTNLLAFNPYEDVVTQVFGSARNNEAIRECLLEHLDEDADQLSRIVDQMKADGFVDGAYSTAAIAFVSSARNRCAPADHREAPQAPDPLRGRMGHAASERDQRRRLPIAAAIAA